MEETITIKSDNGKHSLEMSEELCKDMMDIWGIDMKKFVGQYLNIKSTVDPTGGKWNFSFVNSMTNDDTTNEIGFRFTKDVFCM